MPHALETRGLFIQAWSRARSVRGGTAVAVISQLWLASWAEVGIEELRTRKSRDTGVEAKDALRNDKVSPIQGMCRL